jgi:hypothetical protein
MVGTAGVQACAQFGRELGVVTLVEEFGRSLVGRAAWAIRSDWTGRDGGAAEARLA